jgi:hypothetical protein
MSFLKRALRAFADTVDTKRSPPVRPADPSMAQTNNGSDVQFTNKWIGSPIARTAASEPGAPQEQQTPMNVEQSRQRLPLGVLPNLNCRAPVVVNRPEVRAGGEASDRGRAERFDAGSAPLPSTGKNDLAYGTHTIPRTDGGDQ